MKCIHNYRKSFSSYLQKYIRSLSRSSPKELYKPCLYILNSNAKYIRPILCMLSCEMYGKTSTKALPAALSIELFHTFSLIHDDILDNSPIRRGKKTIHTKWNTNIAILSGDILLIEAYKTLTYYPSELSHKLLKILTKTSSEICEGQQEDMNFEKQELVSSSQYLEMIRKKTSVLLGASLQMGAIIAEASYKEQKKLREIGENIGLAFQIMDDYLDSFGNPHIFGKKTGNDILNNKKTFLFTKAIEVANKKELETIKQILKMPAGPDKIDAMKSIYIKLNVTELTLSTIEKIHQKNIHRINQLKVKNEKAKNTLINLSEQLIKRAK